MFLVASAAAQNLPRVPQSGAPTRPGAAQDTGVLELDGSFAAAERCATPTPDVRELTRANREVEAVLARVDRRIRVEIPLVFHVLWYREAGKDYGRLSEERIAAQVEVLNTAFKSSGVQFRLDRVNHVRRKRWYQGCSSWWIEEQMKAQLAIAPKKNLNVYSCGPTNGTLGYSTFPWEFEDQPFMQGIVINQSTLPGGTRARFDEGDTAVHEVGHYLGLLHTFENACYAPGDEVSDTPAERAPAFGCPVPRRSCGSATGRAPVRNFMNYADDSCMDEFTEGQGRRMRGFTSLLGLDS